MKVGFMIKSRQYTLAVMLLIGTTTCGLYISNPEVSGQGNLTTTGIDSIVIGEVIQYKNLQIYPLIYRPEETTVHYMVLSEAIQKQLVVVEETGSVNQLQIDNISDDYIFILAGDIVKGGNQDRTMGNDVIIVPKASNIPLESYCVESGRWRQRGEEEAGHFSDHTKTLTSKDLKLASRYQKNQSDVWQKVAEEQEKLNRSLGSITGEQVEVRSTESETSLQLTLENKDLEDIVKEYKENMNGLNHLPDATAGFAYAINGKLYGIDIYNDPVLFDNLKAKVFEAVIVEAISEYSSGLTFDGIGEEAVLGLLKSFDQTTGSRDQVNEVTVVLTYETDQAVEFETRQVDEEERWVRKNYLIKGDSSEKENDKNLREQRTSE